MSFLLAVCVRSGLPDPVSLVFTPLSPVCLPRTFVSSGIWLRYLPTFYSSLERPLKNRGRIFPACWKSFPQNKACLSFLGGSEGSPAPRKKGRGSSSPCHPAPLQGGRGGKGGGTSAPSSPRGKRWPVRVNPVVRTPPEKGGGGGQAAPPAVK